MEAELVLRNGDVPAGGAGPGLEEPGQPLEQLVVGAVKGGAAGRTLVHLLADLAGTVPAEQLTAASARPGIPLQRPPEDKARASGQQCPKKQTPKYKNIGRAAVRSGSQVLRRIGERRAEVIVYTGVVHFRWKTTIN